MDETKIGLVVFAVVVVSTPLLLVSTRDILTASSSPAEYVWLAGFATGWIGMILVAYISYTRYSGRQ